MPPAKIRRSKLLNTSLFGDFLRSTLSWWRRVKISASSEDFDRNNPMTAHQISLRMSPIGASIARFAALRQLDRVYGSDRGESQLSAEQASEMYVIAVEHHHLVPRLHEVRH